MRELIEKVPLKSQTSLILAQDEDEAFPQEALQFIQEGLLEYFIPQDLGGKMKGIDQTMVMGRLLSRRNLTTAIALGQTLLGSLPVWLYGNEKQKKDLANILKAGGLNCLALTEEVNGSDLASTQTSDLAGKITGRKWCINNATRGKALSVLAMNENQVLNVHFIKKSDDYQGTFKNIDKLKTLGIRGADISGIEFTEFSQVNSQIGKAGQGLEIILKTMQVSRLLCASFSLGASDTTLRRAFEFAQARILYGKPIIEIPAVWEKLQKSFQDLLIIEAFSLVCARMVTMNPEVMSLYSAFSKFYTTKIADQIILRSTEVLGARFYIRDSEFGITQKMMRDHRVVSLFDGNSDVNISIIAGQIKRLQNIGPLEVDAKKIFTMKEEAPAFTGEEKLKLTNRGKDIIWESINHYDIDEKQTLLAEREALFDELKNIADMQSIEAINIVHRYTELTFRANYALFCYFNQNDFAWDMKDSELPLKLVQGKFLFSHFKVQIND